MLFTNKSYYLYYYSYQSTTLKSKRNKTIFKITIDAILLSKSSSIKYIFNNLLFQYLILVCIKNVH